MTVRLVGVPALSIRRFDVSQIPPPSPDALLPVMVLLCRSVCLEFAPAEKMKRPPPTPLPVPLIWLALLFRICELLIDMRARSDTQMAPPLPAALGPDSATVLFWKMLLVNVARPVPPPGSVTLKVAIPPPLPSVVLQSESVTWSIVRFAFPLVPVSNSMHPPSPSNVATVPWFLPNFMVRLEMLAVAFVRGQLAVPRSSLTFITMSMPLVLVVPAWMMVVAWPAPTMLIESLTDKAP